MDLHWLAILLLTPLPILLAVALYAWPKRTEPGPRLLLGLMLAGSVATIAYAGELFGQTLEIKLFWLSLWYISMNLVTWLLLLLALWHTGREQWLTPRRIGLLLAPVVIILLLYFTNPWHQQFYHRFGLDPAGPLPLRTSVRGPLYWVDMALVYAYLLATVVLLAGAWRTMKSPYNAQSAVLLLAALAPMIGGGLHLLGLNAFGYVNFSALALLVTGITYAWGISRHRMFDLMPVVHRTLFEDIHVGVIVIDGRGRIAEINPFACRLLGAPRKFLIGQSLSQQPPPWYELDLGALRAHGEPGAEITLTIDGSTHYLSATAEALPTVEGAVGNATVVVLQDITARKQAERIAQEQQRQVTILEEREHMARDLHDGVGQVLGYVSTQTQSAREYLRTGQVQIADAILAQLAGVTQDAHADIRNFILGAPPGSSAPADLVTALAQLVQRFEVQYGQAVRFAAQSAESTSWVTPYQQTQLLYVVQEALTNIRKHTQTATASVTYTVTGYQVAVTIADDGAGFDPKNVSPEHFGLQIMQSRMAEAGGSLEVISGVGQGTQVTATLHRALESGAPPDQLAGLRVLLADDQPLFRDGLHNLLAARGIEVIGVAANGAEAVKMAAELQPDVVIMDVNMPVLDGLAATEQIKQFSPQIQVLVLTVAESDATLVEALRRGASGYLLKNLDAQTLFTMLEQLRRGELVLTPTLATHLVSQFAHGDQIGLALSARQREILRLMAQGYTYREIAERVHLSESAVKYNAGQILERLHVRTRAQAVREAEKRGMV